MKSLPGQMDNLKIKKDCIVDLLLKTTLTNL